MKLDTIRKYASGTSPIIGIPIFRLSEGKHIRAVFRRDHLRAALSAPVTEARYDEKQNVLVLNGSAKAEYRLRDLRCHAEFPGWKLREQLSKWAAGKRKSVHTRGLAPNAKRVIKLQAQIAKLERAKEKIRAHRPHPPLILSEWPRQPASARDREQESRWRDEKPVRRKLGRLVRQPRKTWADFYRQVGEIIGRSVSDCDKHDRVCNRRGGPDRLDYLQYIYKHISMAPKPYERSSTWNPYRVYEYAGDNNGLNYFQQHRHAQVEYLAAMRERASFDSQIQGLRKLIAELVGENCEAA